MPVPEVSAVMQAVNAVLQANAIGEGACRITYSRGVGERGLLPPACPQPTLVVSVAAAGKELPPARLVLCRTTRRNEASALSRCKTLNYGDGLLARMEAESRGADDAVLLNSQGRVAESSISSLFYRWEGQWWTPPVEEGALPGVRRAELIAAGMVRERPLSVSELDQVAAMILGNALSLRAVSEWEGRGVNLAVAQEVVACWTRG